MVGKEKMGISDKLVKSLWHDKNSNRVNDFDLGNKIDWVILQNTSCKFGGIYKKYPNIKIIKKNEIYNYICNN